MTKDVAEAEDLTQDAFMQVFRNLNSFHGNSAFSTWLYRIAVNTVLMKVRRKSPQVLSLDEPVSRDSPSLKRKLGEDDLNLLGAIDRVVLRRAIEELPGGCRQIFDLHEVEGYAHREIAEQLQCSIGELKIAAPQSEDEDARPAISGEENRPERPDVKNLFRPFSAGA
jgi:RNA polymerase sigma-70 factor, ECF subfamily